MRRIRFVVCVALLLLITILYTENVYTNVEINTDTDMDTDVYTVDTDMYTQVLPPPTIELVPTIEVPIVEQAVTAETWWTEYDLDLLAAAIHYEAGSSYCTDEQQQLTGQVVVNRMNDPRYPSIMYDVITDTKYGVQYSTSSKIIANAGNRDIIPQRCYDNALAVLNGMVECPENVIFQANFKQGTGVYKVFETSHSTSYFCYG